MNEVAEPDVFEALPLEPPESGDDVVPASELVTLAGCVLPPPLASS
jgi:hypothetical protein